MNTTDKLSNVEYQSIPYAYHSGNASDGAAARACLTLASLFTDDVLPFKAVPFMKTLVSPLVVEGKTYRLMGLRLEVVKGEVGYQLMLQTVSLAGETAGRTIYLMAFPRYPLMTRLHVEGELACPLQRVSGTSSMFVHLMELVEKLHPTQGNRAVTRCLEAAKHIERLVKRGFRDGLSLTLTEESLVVSKGMSLDTEETVYAAPIQGA